MSIYYFACLQLAYLCINHLLDLYLDAGGLDDDQLGKLGQQIHQQLLKYKKKYFIRRKLKLKFFERLLFNTCVRRTYGQTCTDALIQTHLYRRTYTNKLIQTHLYRRTYTNKLIQTHLYRRTNIDAHIRTNLYGRTYIDAHIRTNLYRRTYIDAHIRTNLYGRTYTIRTHLTGFNYTDALKRPQLNECT